MLMRFAVIVGVCVAVSPISGALAEDKPKPVAKTAREEIKAFCANIADAARDQRYLLQKEELRNSRRQVDERIAVLETRKSEYEDWLKKRNEFLKQAEAGLTDIYKKMKPDAAAAQLELLDPNLASAIIMKLAFAVEPHPYGDGGEEGRNGRRDHVRSQQSQYIKEPVMKAKYLALAADLACGMQRHEPDAQGSQSRAAMSPIGTGLQYTQQNELAMYPKQPAQSATGYSLWSDQKADLFKDARALKIGDILTVTINIDDQAKFDNTTDRSRDTSWSKKFGLNGDDSTNSIGLSADISNESKTSTKGDGSIERKEKLTLQVAVVVTGSARERQPADQRFPGSARQSGTARPESRRYRPSAGCRCRQQDLLREDRRSPHLLRRPRSLVGSAERAGRAADARYLLATLMPDKTTHG
jgi:flagellar basal body L-ring protein FlgH